MALLLKSVGSVTLIPLPIRDFLLCQTSSFGNSRKFSFLQSTQVFFPHPLFWAQTCDRMLTTHWLTYSTACYIPLTLPRLFPVQCPKDKTYCIKSTEDLKVKVHKSRTQQSFWPVMFNHLVLSHDFNMISILWLVKISVLHFYWTIGHMW